MWMRTRRVDLDREAQAAERRRYMLGKQTGKTSKFNNSIKLPNSHECQRTPVTPSPLRRQKHEDCYKFRANLVYALITQQDHLAQNQKEGLVIIRRGL
jgi:hypothetical protein